MALLLFAPARWLALVLEQTTDGRVQLINSKGSVWDGSAQLVLMGGAGSQDALALPGRLRWQIQPQLGQLVANLQASCCTSQPLHLELQPRWGGVSLLVADSQSSWPARLLIGLGAPWNTIQPSGPLILATKTLRLDWLEGRLAISGQVQMDANDLSSRLSSLRPLGSYRMTLKSDAETRLDLETLSGSLLLSGHGNWQGSRLHFEGQAQAAPGKEEVLSNLLNIIGRRNGAQSIITLG